MKKPALQNILYLRLLLSSLTLTGCGDDSESAPPQDDDEQELLDPDLISTPCIESDAGVSLPASAASTQNEIGLEIYAAVTTGNAFIPTFETFYFPPASAERLEPDGIYINEGDVAYVWGAGDDRFIYKKNGTSYSIYEAGEDDRLSQEIIYVEQDESCSKFNLTQYAGSDDDQRGKVVFYFFLRNEGSTKRMEFGGGAASDSPITYLIHTFPDTSGEFEKSENGDVVLSANWNPSGEGSFARYDANGTETDNGTWSF